MKNLAREASVKQTQEYEAGNTDAVIAMKISKEVLKGA